MTLRLPLRVELFNEKDERIQTIVSTKKSQIRLRLHALSTGKQRPWAYGTCRVYYNRPNDFWNEFRFANMAQLDAGLITVTEKPLIDFLKPDIPSEYLEKRKMSPAQRAVLLKAQANSPMAGGAR